MNICVIQKKVVYLQREINFSSINPLNFNLYEKDSFCSYGRLCHHFQFYIV